MGDKSVGCKALASSLKKLKAMIYPVKRAKKLYGFFLFFTVIFFQVVFPQSGFSVITDTTNYLIIPVGETYTSSCQNLWRRFVCRRELSCDSVGPAGERRRA